MSLLIDEALMWWVSIEQKLHITPLQVSWELFKENFRSCYLSEECNHQQKAAFHVVQQRGRSIEEYEAEFCALVHHVDYMVDNGRQAEIFLHGIDEDIHIEVVMWKLKIMADTSNMAKQIKKKY